MKDNPELAQLMGKAQGNVKDNNTKDPVNGAMDSIKNAFSDKGIIGEFASKNKDMLAGAGAGLMVGGPMGAVVGGLAGQVAAMTDFMKPKTAKEDAKKDEKTETAKLDKPRAEASPEMKTLTDNMSQLVLISQKQIEQQREMIDTLGRHKDIAERHYQSSL
jgi:gas vesicle protein